MSTARRVKFLRMFAKLIDFAERMGIEFIVYYFDRTAEEQKALYDKGRTPESIAKGEGIVTNCDGRKKKSAHQKWEAGDVLITNAKNPLWAMDEWYTLLGEEWERLGGEWGGRWTKPKDIYHFQLPQ